MVWCGVGQIFIPRTSRQFSCPLLSRNHIAAFVIDEAPGRGYETRRWGGLAETWGHCDSEGTSKVQYA